MLQNAAPSPIPEIDLAERFDEITAKLGDQGLAVLPNFISPEWSAQLLNERHQQFRANSFQMAGVGRVNGRTIDGDIRGDKTLWLDQNNAMPAQQRYLGLLEQLRQRINRDLILGLFDLETHAAVYPAGSFYDRHLDCFQACNRRVITTVLYLNPFWRPNDGGALRIELDDFSPGNYLDVLPEAGTLVAFMSEKYHHQVLPTRRARFSITSWFSRREEM